MNKESILKELDKEYPQLDTLHRNIFNKLLSKVIDGYESEQLKPIDDIELLSSNCHDQWSGWMSYLFSKCERATTHQHYGEQMIIPKWAVDRWKRQSQTKYKDLPEKEKESDREEARNICKTFGTAKVDVTAIDVIVFNALYDHTHYRGELSRSKYIAKAIANHINKEIK